MTKERAADDLPLETMREKRGRDLFSHENSVLKAINDVFREALAGETVKDVVKKCLAAAQELTGSRMGFVYDISRAMLLKSDPGRDSGHIWKRESASAISEWAIRDLWNRVVKDKKPVLVNDPGSLPEWAHISEAHADIASFLAVPLKREDQIMGMIGLANKRGGYTRSDQQDIEALSEAFLEALTRKRMEERLRISEEKYQGLVENALVGVYQTNPDGKILFANKALAEILEFESPEEIVGANALEMFKDPQDRERLMEQLLSQKTVGSFECEALTRTGKARTLIVSAVMEKGTVSGMVRDITQRNQAEKQLQQTLDMLRQSMGATIRVIDKIIESRDPYTSGHQRRVSDLARSIAKKLNLSEEIIDALRMAAKIHDIGKITVPAEILAKPTPLTNQEFGIIKNHPKVGYDILKDAEFPWPVAQIVLQHHERIDGSGYPHGLCGDKIILEAKILAVADVVEAMASHRPYRPALGIDRALEEISEKKGILYDPEVVDACTSVFSQNGYAFNNSAA